MTNFESASLDRLCKRRAEKDAAHENSPPELRTAALAKRFGVSQAEIVSRVRAYRERLKRQ